jgi:hypothetical protein
MVPSRPSTFRYGPQQAKHEDAENPTTEQLHMTVLHGVDKACDLGFSVEAMALPERERQGLGVAVVQHVELDRSAGGIIAPRSRLSLVSLPSTAVVMSLAPFRTSLWKTTDVPDEIMERRDSGHRLAAPVTGGARVLFAVRRAIDL